MYLGSWKIDDYLTFGCNTHRFDTGAATDADSVPTYRIYEDETAGAILTGSTALLDSGNTAGFYSERVQLTAAAGLEKGKTYTIYISATVNSIEGTMSHTFQIEAEVDANAVSDKNSFNLAADQSGATIGTVSTLTGHTAQTGDSFARIGAPTAASISADLVVIDNFVDDLETRLSAARAGYLDNLSAGAVALATGVDLTSIHGAALTETVNGYLAAAFVKLFNVATPLLVASDVMRGTDSAYTGTPPTAAAIVNEWESQSQVDPTGFHVNVKEINGTAQTANDNGADINSILTDTAEIGVAGAGLTDLGGMSTGMKAEVESEANDALIALNLDHLMKTATGGADMTSEVVDNTVLSRILANGDTSIFVPSTDGFQPIRDRGDAAWTTGAGGSDRLLMVDTTIATLASQTSFTLTVGSADDDAYNNCTIVIEDASTATQKAVGLISNYVGSTKTVTLKYDPAIFTMAATDKIYILAENALKSTLANRQLNVAADGDIAGNVDGNVASVVGHTAQTGDSYAIVNHADHGNAKLVRSTTPANALDVSATGEAGLDFNNIKNAAGAHTLTNITVPTVTALSGKTGFALSATGANLILKNSTFALALADAIADEELTGATHNVVNSLGRRVREIGAYAINSGTAQAGNSTTITLAATASAIDGTYNRNLLVLTDNTGVGQTRTIVDYDGSTKIAIIDREWRTNPDATTVYQIVADDTPLVVDQGVAQAGSTSSTIKLRAYASSINDTYLCNIVIIVAGTGRGQARLVGAYDGTSKVVTLCGDNWVTTPDGTSVYVMIPYGATCTSCVGTDALAQIKTEVDNALDTAIPGSPTAHSINQRVKAIDELTEGGGSGDLAAILTDTDALTTRLPAALTEPTQGAPSATPAPMDALAYLYMFLRNKRITSATLDTIYADDGSTALIKTTIADDGSTLTKSEYISGA